MSEQESREALQQALIDELVVPLIPVAEKALREMLTGKNKAARDMKAAYIIAELGRDLVLKGGDSRDAQRRKAEIMDVVREFMAVRGQTEPEEPKKSNFFDDVEAERSAGNAGRDGTRAPAPAG